MEGRAKPRGKEEEGAFSQLGLGLLETVLGGARLLSLDSDTFKRLVPTEERTIMQRTMLCHTIP